MNYKNIGLCLGSSWAFNVVHAETIEFVNGDQLDVEIIQQTATTLTFVHPILGEHIIDKAKLNNIATLDLQKVELAPPETIHEDQGLFGTGFLKDWHRNIELGLNGASGVTDNIKFRTAFNTYYEDEWHKWDFKSFYMYSGEDNAATENKLNISLVKDWFFKDTRWFGFASVTYEWDEFRDWEHRLQLSVGPAYKIMKTDSLDISARMGTTGIFEFGIKSQDPNNSAMTIVKDTQQLEMMFGADLIWQMTQKQTVSAANYFYPSITDSGEFRNLTNLAWSYDLDFLKGLAFKLGLRNEYDTSQTVENDLKYNASLSFGF